MQGNRTNGSGGSKRAELCWWFLCGTSPFGCVKFHPLGDAVVHWHFFENFQPTSLGGKIALHKTAWQGRSSKQSKAKGCRWVSNWNEGGREVACWRQNVFRKLGLRSQMTCQITQIPLTSKSIIFVRNVIVCDVMVICMLFGCKPESIWHIVYFQTQAFQFFKPCLNNCLIWRMITQLLKHFLSIQTRRGKTTYFWYVMTCPERDQKEHFLEVFCEYRREKTAMCFVRDNVSWKWPKRALQGSLLRSSEQNIWECWTLSIMACSSLPILRENTYCGQKDSFCVFGICGRSD